MLKAQYTCHKTLIDMAQGEFDTLYFIFAGVGRGATIFSFDNSTSLGGGGAGKKPWDGQGMLPKN